MDDEKLSNLAVDQIKKEKSKLIEEFASTSAYLSEEIPISLFMAGSPGAGKTEVSKTLINRFNQKPVRIDADEIREMCEGYTGKNSSIFQRASDKGVNFLFDHCIKHKLNFILDATFAYGGVAENIHRCLEHKRQVQIFFVYQDPKKAWIFTKLREIEQ